MRIKLAKILLLPLILLLIGCQQGEGVLETPDEKSPDPKAPPSPPVIVVDDGGFNPQGDLCYHVECAEGLACFDGLCKEDEDDEGGNHPARIAIEPYPLPPFTPGETIELEIYAEDRDEEDKVFLLYNNLPAGSTFKMTVNELNLVSYHFTWTPTEEGIYELSFVAENRADNEELGDVLVKLTRDLILRVLKPEPFDNLEVESSLGSGGGGKIDLKIKQ